MEKEESAYHLPGELKAYSKLNKKINYLLSLILIVFFLGIIFYSEKFDFLADPLSSLGEIHPEKANSNLVGFSIFMIGMLTCSILSFRISYDLKDFYGHFLFKITAAGFILLSAPSNQLNIFHSMGGALVVGSLWWFCVAILKELFKATKKIKIIVYHILLHSTVLPYAFLYFAGLPERQLAQKFAVLGLILVLKFSTCEYLHYLQNQTKD